jgi:predicted nucleic acid-binding protein
MLCRELVIDTSGIINIIQGSIAEPCLENIDPTVAVTPTIESECRGNSETSVSLQKLLEAELLEKSDVEVASTTLVEFMEKNNLGAGESEAILTCQKSGRHLWCDDRRARRVGSTLLGNL